MTVMNDVLLMGRSLILRNSLCKSWMNYIFINNRTRFMYWGSGSQELLLFLNAWSLNVRFSKVKAKFLFVRKKSSYCALWNLIKCLAIMLCARWTFITMYSYRASCVRFFYVHSSVELKLIRPGQYTIQCVASSISHLSVQCMKVQRGNMNRFFQQICWSEKLSGLKGLEWRYSKEDTIQAYNTVIP